MKTNTKVQTKVTSLQSPVSSLLQRPCAGDNHPIAAMSDVPPVTCLRSGFAHDFSAIPAHPEAPGRLQTKLTVSTPSDMYEQEADAMADTVMRMPENQSSLLRRNQSRAKPSSEHMAPTVRPKNEVGAAVSNTLSKKIISSQGAGSGMESNTQSAMQNRFGADFSRVKIHTDGEAVQMSRELGAQAFTVGRDIYFDAGTYSPGTDSGRRLLAHELTHTIQQGYSRSIQTHIEPRQQSEEGLNLIRDKEKPLAQRAIGAIQPRIQRSTKWAGATVHETRNKAADSLAGDAPVTWQMLNGTMLKSDADADGAIKFPTLATSGTGSDWKAKVDTVPEQTGGDDETVLAPGPWSTVGTKAQVRAKFGLAACTGAGNSTFSANGKPSDDAVFKANRRHEDHHVADDKIVFEDTVGKWDTKVRDAKDKGTEFKGASAVAANVALWVAVGGHPYMVAEAYNQASLAKGAAYHGTAAGGPMSISNAVANADCSTSSVDVTNPS